MNIFLFAFFFTRHDYFEIHLDCRVINGQFLYIAEWHSIVWIYGNLFIQLSVGVHLHGFQFVSIENKVVMEKKKDKCLEGDNIIF